MEKQYKKPIMAKRLVRWGLFFTLVFIFQSCKKAEVENSPLTSVKENHSIAKDSVVININPDNFFKIPFTAPSEVVAISKQMQIQFKEQDVRDFTNWYGLPLWDNVLRTEKANDGSITYMIAIQNGQEINTFFAAIISKDGKIKFEIHKKENLKTNRHEYSYANITFNKSRAIFNYFNKQSNSSSLAAGTQTSSFWECFWTWVNTTNLQASNSLQTTSQHMEAPHGGGGYWLETCFDTGGSGGSTGGGTGGTGSGGTSSGNEPPCFPEEDSFSNNWWNNGPASLTACDLTLIINHLNASMGGGINFNNIQWLISHPDRAVELNNYVGDGTDYTKRRIAFEHLQRMINDWQYLIFVENHAQTGDNTKMWWEDNNWLNNSANFNLDITRVNGGTYELNPAEKALTIVFPIQAYIISTNISPAFEQSNIVYGVNFNPLNTKKDAFRHAFFNAINARDVTSSYPYSSQEIVRMFAQAHETSTPPALNLEMQMDLFNNEIGINYCVNCNSLSNSLISNAILSKILAGELKYLAPLDFNISSYYDANNDGIQDCPTCLDGIYNLTTLKYTNQ